VIFLFWIPNLLWRQQKTIISKIQIETPPTKKRNQNGILLPDGPVSVELDSQKIENIDWKNEVGKIWMQREENQWSVIEQPSLDLKGPHRYGTFKDAFKN